MLQKRVLPLLQDVARIVFLCYLLYSAASWWRYTDSHLQLRISIKYICDTRKNENLTYILWSHQIFKFQKITVVKSQFCPQSVKN